ncbi:hypothetical protein Hanom_Chr02g00142901 [Helianthus anomalus]
MPKQARERQRREEQEQVEREAREAAEREATLIKLREEKSLSLGPEPEKGPDVTQVFYTLVLTSLLMLIYAHARFYKRNTRMLDFIEEMCINFVTVGLGLC